MHNANRTRVIAVSNKRNRRYRNIIKYKIKNKTLFFYDFTQKANIIMITILGDPKLGALLFCST